MGLSSTAEQDEPEPEAQAEPEPEPDKQESAGFDLEHIFGSSQPDTEEEPATAEPQTDELNWGDSAPEPATEEAPRDELPEAAPTDGSTLESHEPTAEKASGTLEDCLLDDLTEPDSSDSGQAQAHSSQPESGGGGIDLDDIIDQSGVDGPQPREQEPEPEPPAREVSREQVEPEPQAEKRSELERDLDQELEQAAVQIKSEPVTELPEPEVEPPAMEMEAAQPEMPEDELQPEAQDQPEEPGTGPSLVSLALQRASQEQGDDGQGEAEEPQDEGVEFNLSGDGGDSDIEVQLTMNQTIDAIKKKTVKCPECGTMNYAIRWYCENCEATLTAL